MTERNLLEPKTEIAPIEQPKPSRALVDFRQGFMSLPVEVMQRALAEYKERRETFREWLRSQLLEGTHYGFPPGCEPKVQIESDGTKTYGVYSKGSYKFYPESQWKPKPSFYKAGADFVCDLLNLIDVYDADMDGWEQLGKPPNTFVYRCRLYPKGSIQTPEACVGEGRGARKVGQKGGDENNAIKMAKKAAKVDAVLNAFGLADLFTQDLEDGGDKPERHGNPEGNKKAPAADTRKNRVPVSRQDVEGLLAGFSQRFGCDVKAEPEKFVAWVEQMTGRTFNTRQSAEWTQQDVQRCKAGLAAPMDSEIPW